MNDRKESLFSLSVRAARLRDALEESGGELNEETETLLREDEDTAAKLSEKLDCYDELHRFYRSAAETCKSQKELWATRERTMANADRRLFDHVREAMELLGESRMRTAGGAYFYLQDGPVRTEADEAQLAAPYMDVIRAACEAAGLPKWLTVEPRVNRTALKEEFYGKDTRPDGLGFSRDRTVRVR